MLHRGGDLLLHFHVHSSYQFSSLDPAFSMTCFSSSYHTLEVHSRLKFSTICLVTHTVGCSVLNLSLRFMHLSRHVLPILLHPSSHASIPTNRIILLPLVLHPGKGKRKEHFEAHIYTSYYYTVYIFYMIYNII